MKRLLVTVGLVALALATGATGARQRTMGTLKLNAAFSVSSTSLLCPAGTPTPQLCFRFQGHATIPGLGRVTEQYTATMPIHMEGPTPSCALLSFTPDVLRVGSKGKIELSIRVSAPCNGFPTGFTVAGGTGAYAGASGSGRFTPNLVHNGAWVDPERDDSYVDSDDATGVWVRDTLAGTLTVPNLTFDTTPPVISGAVSKTVHIAKRLTRVRVTFKATAQDAIDGSLLVACTPRSGNFFKIGRTRVTCSATDSNGNTATTRFTVTVMRAP